MKKKCTIFALAIKENRSVDHLTIHRGVEQLAARRAHNPEVGGSSPPPATIEDKSLDLPSFFMVAGGGGLMSSVISTIHPNPPLKRRACGKTLSCTAPQSEMQPHSCG